VVEHRKLHRGFHQLIYTASRRPYLIHALDQMWAAFPTMLLGNFPQTARRPIPGRGTSARQEHRALVRALQDRNGADAERVTRQHVQATADSIATTLKNSSPNRTRREIK
jgi:DNA-binding GntR family transcriptional regulator